MDQRIGDRRKRPASFRLPERRTGFDRRQEATVEVLRDNPTMLLFVLASLNVLNVLDWRLTAMELGMGATEGNPVLAALFSFDSLAAGLFKIALMLGVSVIIWSGRGYRRVLEMAVFGMMVYTALTLYHLAGIALLLWRA